MIGKASMQTTPRTRVRRTATLAATAAAALVGVAAFAGGPAAAEAGDPAGAGDSSVLARPDAGHARSAAELGADTTYAPAPASALRLPGATDPGARDATGRHAIYVLPVYWGADRPSDPPRTAMTTAITDADTYYRTATAGAITLDQGWSGGIPGWTRIGLSGAEAAACDRDAIAREVRAIVGSAGSRDHLVVYLPDVPECDFSHLETLGLSAYGDGYNLANGVFDLDVALRVVVHNGGVPEAGSLDCLAGADPVALSANCAARASTNPWDPGSDHPYGQAGMPLADTLHTLGVIDDADYPEITAGEPEVLRLAPLSERSGQRGAYFDIAGYRYHIEYRVPQRLDRWITDATWTSAAYGPLADPGGGIIVHRQRLSGDATERTRLVVDFHPDAANDDTARHPGLRDGESYLAPRGLFRLDFTDADATEATVSLTFPAMAKVERLSGADRYETSVAVSLASYGPGVDVAYVASGDIYTDALSGAPVAGKTDGPVLLTRPDRIPDVVAGELTRLAPRKIVILGGPATISPAVQNALGALTSGQVVRWAGEDRFETSAAISRASYPADVETVYIASGRIFTDALSGAPVAGKDEGPVLLVDTDEIPDAIATELRRLSPDRVVILGGIATITPDVGAALAEFGTVERWAGPDRFGTSAAISKEAYTQPNGTVYIASGRVFTDALSGAPVAGTYAAPVLLVDTDSVPVAIRLELERLKPGRIILLGGPATISHDVQGFLASYLP